MAKFKIAAVLVIIVLLAFSLTYRKPSQSGESTELTGLFTSEMMTRYPMVAEVTEPGNTTLGIAAEEKFNFGRVPAGSDVTKSLVLVNNDIPVRMQITSEGSIAPFIEVSRNNFLLNGTEEIEVTFRSAEQGNFTGTLSVVAVKPRNWLAGWFLQWI